MQSSTSANRWARIHARACVFACDCVCIHISTIIVAFKRPQAYTSILKPSRNQYVFLRRCLCARSCLRACARPVRTRTDQRAHARTCAATAFIKCRLTPRECGARFRRRCVYCSSGTFSQSALSSSSSLGPRQSSGRRRREQCLCTASLPLPLPRRRALVSRATTVNLTACKSR